MRRRALLGTVVVFVSGCSEQLPTDLLPPTPTEEPTETPTPTASPTPAATPASAPTPTETPTESPTPTEPTDPPETELSLSGRLARDLIVDGRRDLRRAVDAYAAAARVSDPTILDVTAATTRFSYRLIGGAIGDASSKFLEARRKGNDDQQALANRLLDVVQFVQRSGQCQERLVTTYRRLGAVQESFDREDTDAVRTRIDAMSRERRHARNRLADIRSETEAANAADADVLTPADYEAKVEQFDREVSTFGALPDPLLTFADGIESLQRARRHARRDNFRQARDAARSAESTFESVLEALDAILSDDPAASLEPVVSDLRALAEEKRAEADDL